MKKIIIWFLISLLVSLPVNASLDLWAQKLFELPNLWHTTLQSTDNWATRLYLMPKGPCINATLCSGIKMFATDYSANGYSYFDYWNYVTDKEIVFNSKRNGWFASNLDFVWKYQDINTLMYLDARTRWELAVWTPTTLRKTWDIFNPIRAWNWAALLWRNANTADITSNLYYKGSWKKINSWYSSRVWLWHYWDFTFYSSGNWNKDTTASLIRKIVIKWDGKTAIWNNVINPLVSLEVQSTDAIWLPKWTNSQRPTNPKEWYTRFNTETKKFEWYDWTSWITF